MNVVVTGTIGYDYIMNFSGRFADRIMDDKLHKISLSFLTEKLQKQQGGTAGNIAYTLKLLGQMPYIISTAGSDFGPYKDFFRKHRIDTSGIKIYPKEYTGMYFVVTDRDDNQIGAFHMGATKYATDTSILHTSKRVSFAVLAPTQKQAMIKYVKECTQKQIPFMFDPAFQIGDFSPDELRAGIETAAILIGNDYEIALIEQKLHISHEELRLMTPVVITTLGSKGSIVETRKDSVHVKPAKPKNTSDPTGAGDAYRAGFVAGFMKVMEAKKSFNIDDYIRCAQMGSVAAVYTVEKYGTVTHIFTKREFGVRFKQNYNSILHLS